jgi:hypothetical protein
VGVVGLNSSANRGEKLMAEEITLGTILIKEGTPLPEGMQLESEPYSAGWRLAKNSDGGELDRKIHDAGWNFFYMAGEIKVSVFGRDGEVTRRKAAGQVLAKLKFDKFNCVEITQVAAKRFLGLPYLSVAAHWRHIQEGLVLFHAKGLAEWDKPKLATV